MQHPFTTRCHNIVMFTFAEENPGNNKDLGDLHVLHEGKVVFFLESNRAVQSSLLASRCLAIMFLGNVIKFSS